MRFEVRVEALGDGGYLASCDDPQCIGRGLTSANALDAIREEIRYRVELCPCTTVNDAFVELAVVAG